MSEQQQPAKSPKGRRNIVKGIAVGAGSVTISQWSKPVVETVVLPAHATTTGVGVLLTGNRNGGTGFTLTLP